MTDDELDALADKVAARVTDRPMTTAEVRAAIHAQTANLPTVDHNGQPTNPAA